MVVSSLLWVNKGEMCVERNESLVAAAEDKDRVVYDFGGLTN